MCNLVVTAHRNLQGFVNVQSWDDTGYYGVSGNACQSAFGKVAKIHWY